MALILTRKNDKILSWGSAINNKILLFYSPKPRSQVWNSIYRNWSIWDSMGFTPVSEECRRFHLFLFWEWNYMLNHSISTLWLSSLTSIEDLFESWMGQKSSRRLGICPKKWCDSELVFDLLQQSLVLVWNFIADRVH